MSGGAKSDKTENCLGLKQHNISLKAILSRNAVPLNLKINLFVNFIKYLLTLEKYL